MRAFISISIDEIIKKEIHLLLKRYSTFSDSVKWTKLDNIHITLKFIGEINEDVANILSHQLRQIASQHNPFILTVRGVGGFPTLKTARIIWIGLQKSEPLIALHKDIESLCSSVGIKRDDKGFSPHITIARVKDKIPKALYDAIMENQDKQLGLLEVKELFLMKSVLKPEGAEYSVFGRYSLVSQNYHQSFNKN